jgi:hypothetical protein
MKETDKTKCLTLADDVTLYVWGGLTDDLRPAVEAHLRECPSCAKFVAFMNEFIATNRKDSASVQMPSGPHPDASLIVDLEADELDAKTTRKVSLHLLYCRPCREAYLRLRGLSNDRFEELVLAEEINLGEKYGAEMLVGPLRMWGAGTLKLSADMTVWFLKATAAQGIPISIAFYETNISAIKSLFTVDFFIGPMPRKSKELLKAWTLSEAGEELEVKTRYKGDLRFCGFRIPAYKFQPGMQLLVTLDFSGNEQQLCFRLPAKKADVYDEINPRISLNETDKRIVELFALGWRYSDIGKRLSLSEVMVKDHIRSIFAKLELDRLDRPGGSGSNIPWDAINFSLLLSSESHSSSGLP